MQRVRILAIGLLAWMSGAAHAAQPGAAQPMPPPVDTASPTNGTEAPVIADTLGRDSSQRLTLDVRFGDDGPHGFVVDTGAERSVVAREIAERLQLRPAGRARIVGIAEVIETDLVRAEAMSVGPVRLPSQRIPVFAGAQIGGPGLIGLDALEGHRLLIDFRAHRMELRPTSRRRDREISDGDAIVVTARRNAGRLIISDARLGGRRIDLVLDTGSQTSIGNRAMQRFVASNRSHGAPLTPGLILGVTGARLPVERGVVTSIDLAGFTITDLPIAYGDSPAFAALGLERRPAMLLGMDALTLFDRVAIDFGSRRVWFDLPTRTRANRSIR